MEGKETWMNAAKGRAGVLKYDRSGNLRQELVRSGGKIDLTTDERLVNQERAANESLDIFKNGMLVPVKLLDTAEDSKDIAENPNLKSETELLAMFKLQWKKFEVEVGNITNTAAIERMIDVAEREEVDATVRQVSVLRARLVELDPDAALDAGNTVQSLGEPLDGFKVVSPR